MTLYLIGTGIHSIRDISIRAKEAIDGCSTVFLESYTSILCETPQEIEKFLGKPVIVASRTMVEQDAEKILEAGRNADAAFLVIGDVFGATTHVDIFLRAREAGVSTKVFHNASILTAVGITGLELYKFGKTTSMVFFDKNWEPENVYDVIKENHAAGLHTLVLLDIKTAEPSRQDLLKGNVVPQEPRFMSVNQCVEQLLYLENKRKEGIITDSTLIIGCARLGSENPCIKAGTPSELLAYDFGGPLHCLVVPGNLHFMEEDALQIWRNV